MAKFDLKGMLKNVQQPAIDTGLVIAGAIGAQKFLDMKTWFKEASPDEWYIKHQGALKVGGVLITFALWKKMPSWAKMLLIGIAVQGGIQALRQYTMGDNGVTFFEQIGQNNSDMDRQLLEMANQVREGGTGPFDTGVAGPESNTAIIHDIAESGVAGMGMSQQWNVWQPSMVA